MTTDTSPRPRRSGGRGKTTGRRAKRVRRGLFGPAPLFITLTFLAAFSPSGCARSGADGQQGPPEIHLTVPSDNANAAVIEVVGVPSADLIGLGRRVPTSEDWIALLRVSVAEGAGEAPPAVAGAYSVTDRGIVFKPMFAFDQGRKYRVVFDPARLGDSREGWRAKPIETVVGRPASEAKPSTRVASVYPTSDVVPENQLRLYIEFSGPMGLKGGVDYISLLDAQGKPVDAPFLPLDAEFWNGDRTRYTVFFDPGRVKRGILPNAQMGRPLREGERYTLVVDPSWRDAQGLPLVEGFHRDFRVGPPDDRPLDTATWHIETPRSGTRDPISVTFPEPLDHGLLVRALGVSGPDGKMMPGDIVVEAHETKWTFSPQEPWQSGAHNLVALAILEDLAGNRIGRAFEVDRFDRIDRTQEPDQVRVPFSIGP